MVKSPKRASEGWVLGYARVSTRDQNLGLQVEALERFGCNHIFTEKLSATSKNRVELAKLWKELRPGDTLAVWKLDRLARNAREMLNRMHELDDRKVRFVSLTESIDTATAAGKLMLAVLSAMAQFERDLTSERTAAGIRRVQNSGKAHDAWTKKFDRAVMRKALEDWLEWNHLTLDQAKGQLSLQTTRDPAAFERAHYIRTLQSWGES